jgi:hypothetical protein
VLRLTFDPVLRSAWEPLAVAAYLSAFDLLAVRCHRDDRLCVTRDPAGAEAAWSCEARVPGRVFWQANDGNAEAAAKVLGVLLVDYASASWRGPVPRWPRWTSAWRTRSDPVALATFYPEFRHRRLEAANHDRPFMTSAGAEPITCSARHSRRRRSYGGDARAGVRLAGCLPPPSPPREQAASGDETGQAGADDGAGNRNAGKESIRTCPERKCHA